MTSFTSLHFLCVSGGYFTQLDPWSPFREQTSYSNDDDEDDDDDDSIDEAIVLMETMRKKAAAAAAARKSKYSPEQLAALHTMFEQELIEAKETHKKMSIKLIRTRRAGCELLSAFSNQQLRDKLHNMAVQRQ